MEGPSNSRYIDAMLLLSLKVKEENGEKVIKSTSCISSSIMRDLIDMKLIDYAQFSGDYVFTEKGLNVLKQIREAPWGEIDIYWASPQSREPQNVSEYLSVGVSQL